MKPALLPLICLAFVYCSSTAPVQKQKTALVTEKSGLKIRSAPTVKSAQTGFLEYNSQMDVIDEGPLDTLYGISSKWYKIHYKGTTGYAFGGFLKISSPAQKENLSENKQKNQEIKKERISYIFPEGQCSFYSLYKNNTSKIKWDAPGSGAGSNQIFTFENAEIEDLEDVFRKCAIVEPFGEFEGQTALDEFKIFYFYGKTKSGRTKDIKTRSIEIRKRTPEKGIVVWASERYAKPVD